MFDLYLVLTPPCAYLLQSYGEAGEIFSDEEIMSGKVTGMTLT